MNAPEPVMSLVRFVRLVRRRPWLAAVALVVALVLVRAIAGGGSRPAEPSAGVGAREAAETVWTCSMHPQIRLPGSGKCPICFMDLIPVEAGEAEASGPPRLEMTEAARALAEIRTAPAARRMPLVETRLVGKVVVDETRTATISARVAGRLDRLLVDYTGQSVRQADPLAEIYSPELLSAGEELVHAIRTRDETAGSEMMQRMAEQTVTAARDRLRLWGLTPEQIERIEREGTPSDHLTLYAPVGGIVLEKNAVEGDYVDTGTVIYRIADLSRVWVLLDAYESDLPWIRVGAEAEFTAEGVPGRTFGGKVSFVPPTLDPMSRTVKVRVEVPNGEGLLKPEMFVRGVVWAEPEPAGAPPLVVPASAVLLTGKRAIAYVEVPGTDTPTYEGREVTLGPAAGDVYVVTAGLTEGERVVVEGAFKIDSALQIQAKPSMMSADAAPAAEGTGAGRLVAGGGRRASIDARFAAKLEPLYVAYFGVAEALAADDVEGARRAFAALRGPLGAVRESDARPPDRAAWRGLSARISSALDVPAGADIEALRERLRLLSEAMIALEERFGHAGDRAHYKVHCPMAFESGADWLQDHDTVDNPYFGAAMLRCGAVRDTFPGAGAIAAGGS